MQKRFIASIFISLALNFLIKPFSVLVIDAGIQRALGNIIYGKYFALLSLTLITNVLLDFGMNNFTVRNIAQQEDRIPNHLTNIIVFRGLLLLLYSGVVLLLAYCFDLIKNNETILALLIINQFLVQSIALFRSIFSGQHRFALDAFLSVLDRALLIVIVGFVFLQVPNWISIEFFVGVQTGCYFMTFLIAFLFVQRKINWATLGFNWSYVKSVLIQSVPYAILVLLMLIYNRSDTLLIRLFAKNGAFEAGVYAQGFRLLDALYMVGMIFASVLFPMFSRMLHQKDAQLNELVILSTRWLVGGVLLIVFIAVVNSQSILELLYKNQVAANSNFVFIGLMCAFLAMSVNFIFGTFLTANGNLRLLNWISLVAVGFSVGLNLWVIPRFGPQGAVLVAVFVQSLVSLLVMYFSQRNDQLHLTWMSWYPLLLFAGFLACCYPLLSFFPSYIIPFLSVILAVFGLLWFSVVELKSVFKFIAKKELTQ